MSRQRVMGLLPSLILVGLTLVYLVTGYRTLDEESRHVPLITAFLTLGLLGLDLVSGWLGRNRPDSETVEAEGALTDEIRAVLSLVGLVIAIYFLGFYIGGALYLLLSLWWIGKQGARFSIITTVISFACIYLLFEKALAFQLFRGVLFSDY